MSDVDQQVFEDIFGSAIRDAEKRAGARIVLPTYEQIASHLRSAKAGERCPVCGTFGVHTHTPAEFVIYRNGLKCGLAMAGAILP